MSLSLVAERTRALHALVQCTDPDDPSACILQAALQALERAVSFDDSFDDDIGHILADAHKNAVGPDIELDILERIEGIYPGTSDAARACLYRRREALARMRKKE